MARKFFYACAGLFLLTLSWHLGARSAGAQGSLSQQVAVLSGEIPDGGTIPLPTYPDGSLATESECRWTVSTRTFLYQYGGHVYCYTTGRVVHVISEGGQNDPATVANYLIIAVRNDAPIPARKVSWGQLKSQYR